MRRDSGRLVDVDWFAFVRKSRNPTGLIWSPPTTSARPGPRILVLAGNRLEAAIIRKGRIVLIERLFLSHSPTPVRRPMALFWFSVLVGGVLLLFAALYLLAWNWNEDMIPRLISSLGVFVVTLLVAVLTGLKASHQEAKFTTTIVFDESTHKPALFWPEHGITPTPASEWMTDLFSSTVDLHDLPTTPDAVDLFLTRLLEYRILSDLRAAQREGTGVVVTMGAPSSVRPAHPIVALPPAERTELSLSVIRGVAGNPFFGTAFARAAFEHLPLRVPRGSVVTLSRNTPPLKSIIKISRPDYFTLLITVEPVIGAPTAAPPTGFTLVPPTPEPRLTTYAFDVTLTADFDKLSAGSLRTQLYKRWVEWLMAELPRRNTFVL